MKGLPIRPPRTELLVRFLLIDMAIIAVVLGAYAPALLCVVVFVVTRRWKR